MKHLIFLISLLLIIGCQTSVPANNTKPPVAPEQPIEKAPPTETGVIRVFEKTTAKQGEMIKVKLYVNLLPGQTYWLFDEGVPSEFQIQGESDGKNRIKQIVFQDAVSTVYEYQIRAPNAPGTYTFEGEYGVEGEDIKQIKGDTSLVIQ